MYSPSAHSLQNTSLDKLQSFYNFVRKNHHFQSSANKLDFMQENRNNGLNVKSVRKNRTKFPNSARSSNQANTFANVSNKNSIKNMDIMKTFQGAQNSTNVLQINNFSGVGVMSDPIIVRDSLKKLNLNKLGHYSQMLTSRSKKDAQVGGQTVSVENLIDPTSGIQNQLGRELKKSGSKYLKKKQGGKLGDMDQKIYSSLSSQLFSKIRNK